LLDVKFGKKNALILTKVLWNWHHQNAPVFDKTTYLFLTTLVVIGIDCTGICKSNYHKMPTTTVLVWIKGKFGEKRTTVGIHTGHSNATYILLKNMSTKQNKYVVLSKTGAFWWCQFQRTFVRIRAFWTVVVGILW
jgi:hypothetical protein